MKIKKGLFILCSASLIACANAKYISKDSVRTRVSFNKDWQFVRFGAMPNGSTVPEPKGTSWQQDSTITWRNLDLPHDWGIEGPFRQDLPGKSGKLPWAGIGWYRKTFNLPKADQGKRIFLDIDGAMSDSTVFLNGKVVGGWPYGYSSYRVELTDNLNFNKTNNLYVRLDNAANSSRWYPGAGIYRNTWLVKTNPIHISHWGTKLTTPVATKEQAKIDLKVMVDNQSQTAKKVVVKTDIYLLSSDAKSKLDLITSSPKVSTSIKAGESNTIDLTASFKNPILWDITNPQQYVAVTTVASNGKVQDIYETKFGVRHIEFSGSKGFVLNGKIVQLKGVCQHHDLGPLGAAINTRAIERQIEILKSFGTNSIRTSHNPPAPELLDLCDRMGIVVIVEAFDCWKRGKTRNDYHRFFEKWHKKDLVSMVRRDYNHPCVIMWSTGNEIREQSGEEGHKLSTVLTNIIKSEDTTRPVTAGASYGNASYNGFEKTVDVFGFNYKPHLYARYHKKNPDKMFYGSETSSTISSRGEYAFPVSDKKSQGRIGKNFQMSSYDLYAPGWAYPPDREFMYQEKVPQTGGEYVWTGFDYLGEPTPFNRDITNILNFTDPVEKAKMKEELKRLGKIKVPSRSSYFGIVDLCGFRKDRAFIYQARWRPEVPMVHILPHWNWEDRKGKITPVHIYTSGDEVELFLNGKSLGRKKKAKYTYRIRWDDVKYEAGTLKAIAYKNGKKWAESTIKTTGKASQLGLTADRRTIHADGNDLSFVTVSVNDKEGLMVPKTHNLVTFELEGPGEILAVGNGDATSHAPFQAKQRKVFNGLALVIIRSKPGQSGTITLTAKSDKLKSKSITIKTK